METINCTDKIEHVLEHIKHVQENCYKLGLKLIKIGEVDLGRKLIANGQIHDNSKFRGIEFDDLFEGSPILSNVVRHHSSTNPHHPEYWSSIHNMPEEFIAEMVCDCTARSSEFGTDVREWFSSDDKARRKYNYLTTDVVYSKITKYLNMLLSPVFK